MSITVSIPYPHMKTITGNKTEAQVEGKTIGQCLDNLVRLYPGLTDMLFDNAGKLLPFVVIFHNGNGTHLAPDPLGITVAADDKLMVTLLLAGG